MSELEIFDRNSDPIVEVEQGKLQGKKINNKYFAFRGIPFAKPPVGDLRFSVPVAPEPWIGIRDATKHCNICSQFDVNTKSVIGSEDCLYLNVYTPKLFSDDLLPVMVCYHGGGFIFGNGTNETVYGADYLIEKGVIMVTPNYRIGILGFLSLDRKDAPGNMGLRDQVQALIWIKNNIKQFGGDPNNVTIFGISAGAAAIEYLVLSPLAKGYFHKAIAQSGSTISHWAHNENIRDLALKVAAMDKKIIQNDDDLLQYLKTLTAEKLVRLSMMVIEREIHQGGSFFGFVPTIEKSGDWEPFLDKNPYDLISKGSFTKVPLIAGFSSHEGLNMCEDIKEERFNNFLIEKKFTRYLDKFFGIDDCDIDKIADKFEKVYLTKTAFEGSDAYGIDFFSDIDFIGPIYTALSHMALYNSAVYLYEFAYDGTLNYLKKKFNLQHRKGTCHADEIGYLLKAAPFEFEKITEADELVRERFVTMWTNFAKYGVPTLEINEVITTKWEPVGKNMAYMHIDKELSMKQDPYPERMQLLKYLYDTYYRKKIAARTKL